MNEKLEREIISLIAMDRIHIPISSMSGKLKRRQPKQAQSLELKSSYNGERVYARTETEDLSKARGLKDGIRMFEEHFPEYGSILKGFIEGHRGYKEKHLYFGTQDGRKLTAEDYLGVMTSLGLSEKVSRDLYPELIDISRKMSKKRDEERRIIIGKSFYDGSIEDSKDDSED